MVDQRFTVAFVLGSVCLLAQDVCSQNSDASNRSDPQAPVANLVSSYFTPTQAGKAVLSITVRIKPDWHTYSTTQKRVKQGGPIATRIKLKPSDAYRVRGTFATNAKVHIRRYEELWPGLDVERHEGTVTWQVAITFSAGVNPAKVAIEGRVWCQVDSPFEGRAEIMEFVARSKEKETTPKNEKKASEPSTRHNAQGMSGSVRCFRRLSHRRCRYFKACGS